MTDPVDHLNDPAGHFPYKYEAAVGAGLPQWRADLSQQLIDAQQRVLQDPQDAEAIEAYTQLLRVAQQRIAEDRAGRQVITAGTAVAVAQSGDDNVPANG